MGDNALVNRTRTQASANNEQGLTLCGKVYSKRIVEVFNSAVFATSSQVLAYWITRQNQFISWEETLHSFVCNTNLLGIILEHFVGNSRKSVLLLQ